MSLSLWDLFVMDYKLVNLSLTGLTVADSRDGHEAPLILRKLARPPKTCDET